MSKKSAILVIFQIITMIYLIIFNNPFAINLGLVFQVLGIIIGSWGILTMRIGNFNIQPEIKSEILMKSGPYRWIRNPMYTGVILIYLPIIIYNFSWLNCVVFVVLLVTLLLKMISEEQFLEQRFGVDYLLYKKTTKRLIPFIF